jgi:hydrogenase maturation protease
MNSMDQHADGPRCEILIIGYGNTLRGDDGVGPYVATVAASWGPLGVQSLAVPQLTPEIAELLAGAELAIFIDARLDEDKEVVELSPLAASESARVLGHASDPRSLLALAQTVFGSHPRAWLITIPAADVSLGESLSSIAMRGADAALARIRALVGHENLHATTSRAPAAIAIRAQGLQAAGSLSGQGSARPR